VRIWVKEGLVDAIAPGAGYMTVTLDLEPWLDLVEGRDCWIYPCSNHWKKTEVTRAWAKLMYQRGAHGLQLFNYGHMLHGHAGGFSFQSSKNLCSGEGGIVTSNDTAIHNRAVGLMNSGRMPKGQRWQYPRIGWNFRPSEYLAALLTVRLDDLEEQTLHRTRMADLLSSQLALVPGITTPIKGSWCTRHAYHLYMMLIDPSAFAGRSREDILKALLAEGMPVVAGYDNLLSNQQGLKQLAADHPDAVRVEPCPVTEDVCSRSIWLLQHTLLGDEQDISDIVRGFEKVQRAFA
jgi:dTDP-4-amino-4,6-dideoxygalactose transaminase